MKLEKLRTHVAMLCAVILPTLFANNANAQCVIKGTCFDVIVSTSNFRMEKEPANNSQTNSQAYIIFDYSIELIFKNGNTLAKNSCGYSGDFWTFQGYLQMTGNRNLPNRIKTNETESYFPNTSQTAPFNVDMKSNVKNGKSGTVKSARFTYHSYNPDTVSVAHLATQIKWVVEGPGINSNNIICDIDYTTPLPIELIDFKPECGTFGNVINWSTASEQNNELFNIYRSTDASNWDLIKTVKGHGNSNVIQTYQIEDLNFFSGLTYYKLEQVDYSGRSTTFQPAFIQCDEQKEQEKTVSIFPNPISANSVIKANATIAEINFYDISGRKMMVKNNIRTTEAQLSNIDELPSGIFIAEIKFEDNTFIVQKIVK